MPYCRRLTVKATLSIDSHHLIQLVKPILILLAGHAPATIRARHGDFSDWFRVSTRLPPARTRIVDAAAGDALPTPRSIAGAFISGSAAMLDSRAIVDSTVWGGPHARRLLMHSRKGMP